MRDAGAARTFSPALLLLTSSPALLISPKAPPMADPRDRVDIDGLRSPDPAKKADASSSARRFIMIWFRCCHAYGRLTRNAAGTHYQGRCPRCAAPVSVKIGPGGTDRRMFEAR